MTNLRFAFRQLLKSPAFTLVAIATLALGIGANSAIFSVIDAVLLRPLPFPNAERLTMIWETAPAAEVSGKMFNVATGTRITLNQTYKLLQGIIGFKGLANYVAPRLGDVKHSLADITLAKKHLGYTPHVSFEEGLCRTVGWHREGSNSNDL
jgi:hypothetical protein